MESDRGRYVKENCQLGRTGVCWDHSMAESFFSMLKNERVYRTAYATKLQARTDVIR